MKKILQSAFIFLLAVNSYGQDNVDPLIPQDDWTVNYVDSAEGGVGDGEFAFDGDITTMWHTQWGDDGKPHPHELQLNLNATYSLTGLEYTPRQEGGNGRIGDYEIYVSMDGEDWGTAVAVGKWMDSAEIQTVNFEAKTGQYVKIVALTNANESEDPWTTIAEVNLHGVKSKTEPDPKISQSDWTLKYVDSEEAFCCAAVQAFDGDDTTIWHSSWDETDKTPHEIQINLNATYAISALEYTPRQEGGNGYIGKYEIYVSEDGEDWGTAVSEGTWLPSAEKQTVYFEAKTGQYIRIVALSEANSPDNPWTTIAEVNLYGVMSETGNGHDPKISQEGWTLKSTDSEEPDAPAKNAFDGDVTTIWHTRWQNDVTEYPHEMQINLNDAYSLSGFELTSLDPRFRTKDYAIYVSTDGENWGDSVAEGELLNSDAPVSIFFTAKTGNYVKFVVFSTTGDDSTTLLIVSEFNLYGVKAALGTQSIALKDSNFKAYPIPTKGLLNIQIPAEVNGNVDVSVLNIAGILVQNKTVNTSASRDFKLDLQNLSKGLYIVRLKSNSNISKNIKVIVE